MYTEHLAKYFRAQKEIRQTIRWGSNTREKESEHAKRVLVFFDGAAAPSWNQKKSRAVVSQKVKRRCGLAASSQMLSLSF